ncbi:putative hydroxymethylpyrimidine transporter CytX [Clostridium botulinum]|uniref:putative hydroxymethylpyrimidine transporter CytX n=1 Tax=unclassified Clostridium TaxID=2614128 RepID=UPI000501B532|nr:MULTISPECIES: putative hydroxymethylpyrimidine transporter CytX [unclassified Clostridium]AIY80532.1 permease for cytosine/purine, uracil, thiamine, allantoin family protein [Clostridium botulinum 202F]KAI3345851.1 putative hydroxymethylpyrimidine transporter CytX [Clostridium botulinum]KFX54118.1 hydrogenase expression protein [Clostridium botulinum]KON12124.1 hydrogenase expression protein [Clostridium botulinum]MBY6778090.1 putative hydroxymethylpyrimidine transporter CytX [Clostridium b
MNKKKTLLNNGLLWFGASISIAEILTGGLIAPLGFKKGILAIILGHVIGCTLLYFAGLIGTKSGLSSMESSRMSFGKYGSYVFSSLNILQLVGWTAIMIIGGANVLNAVSYTLFGFANKALWCMLISILIIIWILIGFENLGKLNVIAVGGLFILTIILGIVIFKGASFKLSTISDNILSFGMAVELSVAMPLSWLPLIADYTRNNQNNQLITPISVFSYFLGSVWMYIIGLGGSLYAGTSDIAQILMQAGLGIIAMIIVLMSTVTTTFLDVYSAGVSCTNISKKISTKHLAVIVCIIGMLIAMFTPIEQFENFLYLIGSVFAPMISIVITDYFILKNRELNSKLNVLNLIIWVIGFIVYRIFMQINIIVGNTLPVMIIISFICLILNLIKKQLHRFSIK